MTSPTLFLILAALTCLASAFELEKCDLLDLTHEFGDTTVYTEDQTPLKLTQKVKGLVNDVYIYMNDFKAAEHGGTHMDAPQHFDPDGVPAEQVTLKNLVGEGCVVDISDKTAGQRSYGLSIRDLKEWEAKYGRITPNCILVVHTGWSKLWGDKDKFLGVREDFGHLPGILPEAATWIAENRKVVAIGIDTPSIDSDDNAMLPQSSHVILSKMGFPNFENLANTHKLPPRGSTIIGLPIKIKGGSGGPLRAMAYGLSTHDPCNRLFKPKAEL